jgi:NAD(P)-dependent dehydrogenase (short-subunit alcohol dehydrogenase family)
MKVVVIGSGGTIGSAVKKALEEKGHEVVSVGRKSGDYQADIADPESLKALFSHIGSFDAVANAAGDVFPGPLEQTTDAQWANSIGSKGMRQINLVRAALTFTADKGSFTLVSGVLTDEFTYGGAIGTTTLPTLVAVNSSARESGKSTPRVGNWIPKVSCNLAGAVALGPTASAMTDSAQVDDLQLLAFVHHAITSW